MTAITQINIGRPAKQADSLIDAIKNAIPDKIKICHLPLMKIQPVPFSAPDLNHFDGVIFISQNAIEHFFQHASLTTMFNLPSFYTVGIHTAQHLKRVADIDSQYPTEIMNADGLLALADLQNVDTQNWLIIKGVNGRKQLKQSLEQRGANVTELDVYQRQLPEINIQNAIITDHNINISSNSTKPIWLITSEESLNNLYKILNLVENNTHNMQIIVSSDRLAQTAKQKGFRILAQSTGASESQLIQCIKDQLNS